MAYRRTVFAPDEWYHCYTRGVEKRRVFENQRDYERFLEALYLSNSTMQTPRGNFQHLSHLEVMQLPRSDSLVAIGAYCLMPNHFHLLIKETQPGGITKFMQRVGTSYTMYFNVKRKRVGSLFVTPFRSKHIADDRYFQRVAQYIHLNPYEVVGLKKLKEYSYSSLPDYCGEKRNVQTILNPEAFSLLIDTMPAPEGLIDEAAEYYASLKS
jgi:putative transposase